MNCENCRANGICDGIVGDCKQTDKIADKIYQQGRADKEKELLERIEELESRVSELESACSALINGYA